MEDQVDALFPEAQPVSQPSSINPFRVVSSALRSGLLSVQRDNNREMNKILHSIELCEQHVRNQSDYIRRIDAASENEANASVLHGRQLNSMIVSITEQGRRMQTLADGILELLTRTRTIDSALEGQSTQLTNLQAQVRSFEENVLSLPKQEEPQAEKGEPSTPVGPAQPQTPSFLRGRGQPQTPHCQTRIVESRSASPEEEDWTGLSRRSARESTARPARSQRAEPEATEEDGTMPVVPPTFTIPKEVRVKKPEPFTGKKGREAKNFIMRMEVYFNDYEQGTFNDNRNITTTLVNMSPGESMNWSS
jgi:hypothetical protein